ncbi:hypothetical protein QN379_09160 [Glaciimonas sp. Gout2]|uniref:hypothetical protein n=1 Tax=unclassified Glaciimonas TaxID=2644401 RepID=UPI002AB53805|nr:MULTISPECIES: hypothetical protein [unclassified Glaciimonas]MDY7545609.1 hypothetical protein [Glaciimonas sp. CA11.2]MEB0012705.1 hypothetical protein [Glaciimonas sp. Cout2]MEB0082184.1 hypothetical protein [Glaciimonas sp. Gout2]
MVNEELDITFAAPNEAPAQPELLVSAVLHLMSHYTAHHQTNQPETRGCTKLASVIERHLKALAVLPNLAPVLRTTCQQLSEQWATLVERSMPRQEKYNLFARLVTGNRSH